MTLTITITLDEVRAVSNALHNAVSVMNRMSIACARDEFGKNVLQETRGLREHVVGVLSRWDDGLPGGDS